MTDISRRQALGLLAAPLIAGCRESQLFAPSLGTAATGAVESITLIGAGDVHCSKSHATVNRATAALVAADRSATVFALGDNAGVHGSPTEYGYYDDYWGEFRDRTLFMIGNHDLEFDSTADPYYDYTDGAGGPRGKGYYAKTMGAWRVYFLNSEQLRPEQATWLAQDLPNYPHLYKAAFWHKPMFASVCTHDSGSQMAVPAQVGPWWKLLQRYQAELVVSGHVHRYERFPRLTWDGLQTSAGIRQFIVGGGGGIKMPVLTRHRYSQKQVVEHGVFRLTLRPGGYDWQYIDIAGVIRDSGSVSCRALAA